MRAKARRNVGAALLLLERGYADAAASRFYYAAFQAAVHALEARGWKPGDFRAGAKRWSHRMVRRGVVRVRGWEQDRILLQGLRDMRLQADYERDSLAPRRVEFLKRGVERFVQEMTS